MLSALRLITNKTIRWAIIGMSDCDQHSTVMILSAASWASVSWAGLRSGLASPQTYAYLSEPMLTILNQTYAYQAPLACDQQRIGLLTNACHESIKTRLGAGPCKHQQNAQEKKMHAAFC